MDRQAIMETNRSLRTIKNELESLLEKGVIDESAFDTIHSALPAETPLRGAASGTPSNRSANPTPAQSAAPTSPPTQAFQNLGLNSQSPAPPSYEETPAPDVPSRSAKPVVAQARALYHYNPNTPDARDLSFGKGDLIDVHEFMNKDWWMGRNQRTGQEGIFPSNHVMVEQQQKILYPPPAAAYPPQPSYGYPASQGPPPQQNPYNASVPPMAVAEGGQPAQAQGSESKVGEYGKKFGKKLGNAAIFGAGASIGSNIVNSIF